MVLLLLVAALLMLPLLHPLLLTLLDVVVSEGPAILQLLASKDQTLLIWRNSCKMEQQKGLGW
jgi:hypothetical protein